MNTLLGFLLFSFTINAALIVPFINILYTLKFQRPSQKISDFMGVINSVYNKLHKKKAGVPVGGGLLIIVTTCLLYILVAGMLKIVGAPMGSVYPMDEEVNIIFATFILFGILGLYDDVMKEDVTHIKDDLDSIKEKISDHEKRIYRLEKVV